MHSLNTTTKLQKSDYPCWQAAETYLGVDIF